MKAQIIIIAGILALSSIVFAILLSIEVEVATPSIIHQGTV